MTLPAPLLSSPHRYLLLHSEGTLCPSHKPHEATTTTSTQQGSVRSGTATDPPRTSGPRLTPSPSPSMPQELKESTKFTQRIKASTRGLYKPVASLIDTIGVILSLNKLPTTFMSGVIPTALPICIRYLGCLCDELIGHSAQRSYHLHS